MLVVVKCVETRREALPKAWAVAAPAVNRRGRHHGGRTGIPFYIALAELEKVAVGITRQEAIAAFP